MQCLISKQIALLSFFSILFVSQLNAQTVYEWYQDSIVVFQLKTDAKYIIPSQNNVVNIDVVDFAERLKNEFGIIDFYHFFPDYEDDALRNTYQLTFTEFERVDELIKALEQLPFIEYAEKKELHVTFLTPNDLGPNTTNNAGSLPNNNQWALHKILAQQAWDISTGDANIIVAVTDNAINIDHPDIFGKTVPGNDATNQNSTDPRPCGGNNGFHGTHVSGTVGSNTNNNLGVASIGWNVSVMPVKIGRCSDGALTAGYEGIAWSASNGANVINMSWGGGGSSNFGLNVVNNAHNQGAILVAAAGNNNATTMFYPAAYTNVIAVASTTPTDAKSNFSQYGNWINISAPGSNIRSLNATTGYSQSSGTSMASPHVAGLLGLMKSHAPNATNANLVQCLYSSADPVTSNLGQMGAGRINAFAALQCVTAYAFQTDAGITEIAEPSSTVCGNTFTPQIVLRNFGSNPLTAVPINWEWNGTINTFQWTGNLLTGQTEVITLPMQTSGGGSFTFTATTNLAGDQNPSNNSSSATFNVDPTGVEIELTMITDCYGSEITWEIRNDQNNVVASGGPYANVAGGQTHVTNYCLPVGCYTFHIADSYGDGMYGSQWQNCNVNGNYFATTTVGVPLFQMTAPNADFGSGTSHNFCIVDVNVQNDAGISEIIHPAGVLCSDVIIPQVRIQNFGSNILTSALITYNTGGTNQTYQWSGNLTSGQSETLTLPAISSTGGAVNFTSSTSNPNGQTDENPNNDLLAKAIVVFETGIALPFTEDFESNSFSTNLWAINNPDNNITWEIYQIAGTTPGNKAAGINFYNYSQSSQRDGLISPLLNLNGYSSVTLNFEHAYRRYLDQGASIPSPTDSLLIYVSTDCGNSWQKVFSGGEDGSGSFATAFSSNQSFLPANADNWCMGTVGTDCFEIDLSLFIGNQVFVKFEGYNAGTQGNNFYIDNINIFGVPSVTEPVPDFSVSNTAVCEGSQIQFFDESTPSASSWSWQFPGGNPSTSNAQNPVVTYPNVGLYDVTLTASNAAGNNTVVFSNHISVETSPNFQITTTASTNLCPGETLTLETTGNPVWDYVWYLNGTQTGQNNPTLIAFSQGQYQVEATNAGGCSAFSSNTIDITFFDAPIVSVTPSGPLTFCANIPEELSANILPGHNYQWIRNGNPIQGATSTSFTPTQSGNYTVRVTEPLNNCQTTSSNVQVTVNQLPNATIFTPSQNTICGGNIITLNAMTQTGSIYQWQLNGNNIPEATGQTFNANAEGIYTVQLTNISTGCEAVSNAIEIFESNAGPAVQLSQNTSQTLCAGESTILEAVSPNAVNFQWQLNGVNIIGATSGQLNITQSGEYRVVATNSCGSEISESVVINFVDLPDAAFSVVSQNEVFCLGDTTILSAHSSGLSYQWLINNQPLPGGNTAEIAVSVSGSYSLQVSDPVSGCQKTSASQLIQFLVPAQLIITQVGNTLTVNQGGNLQWYYEGNPIPGATSSTIEIIDKGLYTVVLKDKECEATADYLVLPVSVFEHPENVAISIFPNPVDRGHQLMIDGFKEDEQVVLKVKNVLGQSLIEELHKTTSSAVQLQIDLPAGTYFLYLLNNNTVQTHKFIVK